MFALANRRFLLEVVGVAREARQSFFKRLRRKKKPSGDADGEDGTGADPCEHKKKKKVIECKKLTMQPNPCSPIKLHPSPLRFKILFILALPAIGYWTYTYLICENAPKPHKPPMVQYEYLRRRTKRFPWGEGEKSLFHNDHTNILPSDFTS